MEIPRWKFSEQSKQELNDFLTAVKNSAGSSTSIPNTKIWEQLLPKNDSIILSEEEDNNVILIDDDEINVIADSGLVNIPDIINLTLVDIEEPKIDSNLLDLAEYLKESFENEECLDDEIIPKILHYDERNIKELFKTLKSTVVEKGCHNFGKYICNHYNIAITGMDVVAREFCRNILYDHLTAEHPTRIFENLLLDFTKNIPDITRNEILLPLLKTECKMVKNYQNILKIMQESDKQFLLRDFIYGCSKLETWQLSIVQSTLNNNTEDNLKRRLISLLAASADELNSDHVFIKLVIALVQNLGKGFHDQEVVLFNIIEKNQTLLKPTAHKFPGRRKREGTSLTYRTLRNRRTNSNPSHSTASHRCLATTITNLIGKQTTISHQTTNSP